MDKKYRYMCGDGKTVTDNYSCDFLKIIVNKELSYSDDLFEWDFNDGFRIKFKDTTSTYRLTIIDKFTRNLFFQASITPEEDVVYAFVKKYLINYEITIQRISYNIIVPIPIKIIDFDLSNKDICVLISGSDTPVGLGDTIAYLTSVYQFKLQNPNTNIYIHTAYLDIDEILRDKYSECFNIIKFNEISEMKFYATYICGCFFDDVKTLDYCPVEYQKLSLLEYTSKILGIEIKDDIKLDFSYETHLKDFVKPYVCIATHASGIMKEWLNKSALFNIVKFLKSLGYNVYAIDMYQSHKQGIIETSIPSNIEDRCGEYSLKERSEQISGADFFIGVSSGLSWLAWACNKQVVLISGFTNPITEFKTPYRVINYAKCNSCWNDQRIKYDMSKTVCPRKDAVLSDNFLECSTSINQYMVINVLKEIPSVKEKMINFGFLYE